MLNRSPENQVHFPKSPRPSNHTKLYSHVSNVIRGALTIYCARSVHTALLYNSAGMYVSVVKQLPLVNVVLQQHPTIITASYKRNTLRDEQLVQI